MDFLPGVLLRLAVQRVPADVRDDLADEWIAEMYVILHDSGGLPIVRLCRGIWYALGLLVAARTIGDLGSTTPTRGEGRTVDFSGAAVAAASVASARLDVQSSLRYPPSPAAVCPRCPPTTFLLEDSRCPSCGERWANAQDAAAEYAWVRLCLDWHGVKDGGEAPAEDCPECGELHTVVWDQFTGSFEPSTGLCFACTESFTTSCSRCDVPMRCRPDDGVPVCSDCWVGIINSDD